MILLVALNIIRNLNNTPKSGKLHFKHFYPNAQSNVIFFDLMQLIYSIYGSVTKTMDLPVSRHVGACRTKRHCRPVLKVVSLDAIRTGGSPPHLNVVNRKETP